MIKRCIVTDSSCLPTNNIQLPGHVSIVTIDIPVVDTILNISASVSSKNKSLNAYSIPTQELKCVSTDYLLNFFTELTKSFDEVLCLFLSSGLCPLIELAKHAAHSCSGNHKIRIIDSQTTGAGLGLLVKIAAKEFSRNHFSEETENLIRTQIPHVFTLVCTPNLTSIYANKLIDLPQAVIGEMLNMYTIFGIEDGILASVDKAKNQSSAFEYFIEYINEFVELTNIVFTSANNFHSFELALLQEQAANLFPTIPFHHIPANNVFQALWGKSAISLVLQEKV